MGVEQVTVDTSDGACPAYVCTPEAGGPAPAVIFYMDGLGIRPTLVAMGQRLADLGYVVLVPDLFHRAGPYGPLDPHEVFAAGDVRAALGHLFGSTDTARAGADTAAFLDYLDSPDDVAGADQDDSYPPEMAARLEQLLTDAGVEHRCEIYAGARHGFTMPDFPVYDEAAAERHWQALADLFGTHLQR